MEPPPRKPNDSECCGSGCKRCVFDIYDEEYTIWERKVKRNIGKNESNTLHPDQYSNLIITNIQKLTSDVNLYTLSAQDSIKISSLEAGQHVIIKGKYGEGSISRQYTPIDIAPHDGVLHLAIKIYDNGQLSQSIGKWTVGNTVQCRGPLGEKLDYRCNQWETIILIAAGTGVTPMIKIAQTILENDDEETTLILLYACRMYEDILLKELFDKWRDYWNFRVIYFLSKDKDENVNTKMKYREEVICHRITLAFLKNLTRDGHFNYEKVCAFVCGPKDFEISIEGYLQTCRFRKENIRRF